MPSEQSMLEAGSKKLLISIEARVCTFVSHSQMTRTSQPSSSRSFLDVVSRATLRASLGNQ